MTDLAEPGIEMLSHLLLFHGILTDQWVREEWYALLMRSRRTLDHGRRSSR